jgi:trimeric autotransporter adhesin
VISASAGGCAGASVTLTVNPGTTSSVCVGSLSVSSSTVVGGTGLTGTVTLTGPASAGGVIVNLVSNNSQVQVPATVTVR